MRKWVCCLALMLALSVPASAEEWTAPAVTGEAADYLPSESSSFLQDIWYVIGKAAGEMMPLLKEGCGACLSVMAVMLLFSLAESLAGPGKAALQLCGVVTLSWLLLQRTGVMVDLAAETVKEMSGYMKLLLPVLASGLAAQGGGTTSISLYTLTAGFNAVAGTVISGVIVPMVYVFLVLAVVSAVVDDDSLRRMCDGMKSIASWLLKTVLYGYTAFLSVTGILAGTADQAAVKAAKLTISGAVPVVGGILSDASETILVSAGMVKNAVGVYGLIAVVAICIGPFMRIGAQYALVKATAMLTGLFSGKKLTTMIADLGAAMGLLLGMTGTVGLLLMISIVCFLKGMA